MRDVKSAIDYARENMIPMLYSNCLIEGFDTTPSKVGSILDNSPVTTTTDEVLFTINMKEAYEFVFNNLDYNNCMMLLRQLNKLCGDKLIWEAGKVRVHAVSISGTNWKPPIPIEADIIDSINAINQCEDAETKAIAFFCYICRTQMFLDGNKRLAQLMANKILIENGIGIFAVPDTQINKFRELLVSYYETNDAGELSSFLKTYCIHRL